MQRVAALQVLNLGSSDCRITAITAVIDITIETIGLRLQENLLGLLLYADELDMLFSNMGRYSKGKDLPHYITLHNGKTLKIDRKTRDERIYVPHPSVAICGGIQPGVLRKRLEENPDYFHSGFIHDFDTRK